MNITIWNVSSQGFCTSPGHSLDSAFAISTATYFIILIIAALVFNLLLIYAIAVNKALHSSTNLFIVNLAVCDLIIALTTLPFDADFLLRGYYALGKFVCGFRETFFLFSLPSAIINLLTLTLDRFILIVFPHKHQYVFTKRNIIMILIISWSYTFTMGIFPLILDPGNVVVVCGYCSMMFPFEYFFYQVSANFAIPLLSILFMNLMIYRVARKHGRNVQTKTIVRVNLRAAKIIMILCSVCLLCWLPYIIVVVLNVMSQLSLPRWLTWSANAINYSSVALNPIVYGLLNGRIRKVILNKCWPLCLKHKQDQLLIDSNIGKVVYKKRGH